MKKYILEIVVFISGAVVMVFELVGSRVLAPYVGTSTFVWTSLIGIILASLSVGYWLGGKLADQRAEYKVLSWIIMLAAILIGGQAFVKESVMILIQDSITDIRWGSVVAAITLFSLPSILLGMVSPYAVKLKMKSLDKTGRTVGNLYAISTTGSIVGTFSAGFFLIPWLGNTKILLLLAIILIFCSGLVYLKKIWPLQIILVLIFIVSSLITMPSPLDAKDNFIDLDTKYNRVWIYDAIDSQTNQPIKTLQLNAESHSARYLENDDLVFGYTKFYRLADYFVPELNSALMLGGAAYSYPQDFLSHYDTATIDVVEIDPVLTELAKQYFNLEDDPRLTSIHEDGRTYINNTDKKYDAILGDAFTSYYSVPYQLATVEAVARIYDLLTENGVAIINIASAIEGPAGKFLRAELATYREYFPQVFIFPVSVPNSARSFQNIIMVAMKSDQAPNFMSTNPEYQEYLDHLWTEEVTGDMPVLTDDYAPVDYYINQALNEIY